MTARALEADEALLRRRLVESGLRADIRVTVHQNRTVLVHVRGERVRVHRGFAYAPDRILRAVVAFVGTRSGPGTRAARQQLASFRVHDYVPAPGPRVTTTRPRLEDAPLVARLRALHRDLNAHHFGGRLGRPELRISRRMRRRLGALVASPGGGCAIVISGRHLAADGWEEVGRTLLHEMVHQWQVEQGRRPDHGAGFRRKARDVGIEPRASRSVPRHGCGATAGG